MPATATQSEAAPQDISTLLETITNCLSGTGSSLPKATKDEPTDASIDPPQEGISLLNTKSELLLSYLHNLVFLTIFQLRGLSSEDSAKEENQSLREDVVKKLTELRVYLERGVRPLEGRLKYQVDKVVKAAEDAERDGRNAPTHTKSKTKKAPKSDEDESGSGEASSDSEDDDSEDEEDIDEMAYRPNVSAFSQAVEAQAKPTKSDKTEQKAPSDGIYRPPKIMPTALPTTERREREDRRPRRSNVIDEFVNAEMSSAPTMEASIGSTIRSGGRHTRSQKEKDREEERRAYEETNFVRLPKLSKEEQKKQRGRRGPESTFGGEDWKGLTEGADRIARLTQRGKGSGSALDKSRKRKTAEDMPRGDGAVGQIFDKRRKKVDSWKR